MFLVSAVLCGLVGGSRSSGIVALWPKEGQGFGTYARVGSRSKDMFLAIMFGTSETFLFTGDERSPFFGPLEPSATLETIEGKKYDSISLGDVSTAKVFLADKLPSTELIFETPSVEGLLGLGPRSAIALSHLIMCRSELVLIEGEDRGGIMGALALISSLPEPPASIQEKTIPIKDRPDGWFSDVAMFQGDRAVDKGMTHPLMIDPGLRGLALPSKIMERLVIFLKIQSKDVSVDSLSRLNLPCDSKGRYTVRFDSELRFGEFSIQIDFPEKIGWDEFSYTETGTRICPTIVHVSNVGYPDDDMWYISPRLLKGFDAIIMDGTNKRIHLWLNHSSKSSSRNVVVSKPPPTLPVFTGVAVSSSSSGAVLRAEPVWSTGDANYMLLHPKLRVLENGTRMLEFVRYPGTGNVEKSLKILQGVYELPLDEDLEFDLVSHVVTLILKKSVCRSEKGAPMVYTVSVERTNISLTVLIRPVTAASFCDISADEVQGNFDLIANSFAKIGGK